VGAIGRFAVFGYHRRMPKPLAFLKELFQRDEAPRGQVLQIFTPQVAAGRSLGTRLFLAGLTGMGLASAGLMAAGSLLMLLLALGALYWLLTQVLGLELDVDPRLFVERAQAYAASARN
jgi:hypothetical protein